MVHLARNVGDVFVNIALQCFVTLLHEALRTYASNVCKVFCAVNNIIQQPLGYRENI